MARQVIRLEVTAEDIAAGRRKDPSACPIALALRRSLGSANPWAIEISVGRRLKWIASAPGGNVDIGGDLPRRTLDFVSRWDAGKPVEPGALKLWMGS